MIYSVLPYLRDRWDRTGRALAFQAHSPDEWKSWQAELVRKLRDLTGYSTMQACPLNPEISESVEKDGYTRQRVVIETEPGVRMPLYVLLPRDLTRPAPAVIAAHGHGSGGKYSVAGCTEIPGIEAAVRQFNYDYGVQLAKEGFIVFCPDARGFGERQEQAAKGNLLASSCQWINNMAYPLGQTVTGMWAWDLHRLVDYIGTRTECRAGAIGCAGLSGGGLQTLWASAFDPRIRCSVISGYLYGYRESLLDMHGNCSCNYVPHLYEYADIGDVAALIAPRPLLVETGDQDPLNGASKLGNVLPQVETIRRAYTVSGAPESFRHHVFPGDHRWCGEQAVPWLKQWLMQP